MIQLLNLDMALSYMFCPLDLFLDIVHHHLEAQGCCKNEHVFVYHLHN